MPPETIQYIPTLYSTLKSFFHSMLFPLQGQMPSRVIGIYISTEEKFNIYLLAEIGFLPIHEETVLEIITTSLAIFT